MRSVLAAAKRAGVEVAQVQIGADGSIVITGTPNGVLNGNTVTSANPWDEVLSHAAN